jgi:hypothetical protein
LHRQSVPATPALRAVYCRAGRAKREQAIMRSAPNRHAPLALQHRSQSGYFIALFANLSTAQSLATSPGADTTQPPS